MMMSHGATAAPYCQPVVERRAFRGRAMANGSCEVSLDASESFLRSKRLIEPPVEAQSEPSRGHCDRRKQRKALRPRMDSHARDRRREVESNRESFAVAGAPDLGLLKIRKQPIGQSARCHTTRRTAPPPGGTQAIRTDFECTPIQYDHDGFECAVSDLEAATSTCLRYEQACSQTKSNPPLRPIPTLPASSQTGSCCPDSPIPCLGSKEHPPSTPS